MEYTHAVYLMSGAVITVTENQMNAIKNELLRGAEWIPLGNELVHCKSISRVGYHQETANMQKRAEENLDMKLAISGRSDLVDKRRELVKKIAIGNTLKEKTKMLKLPENGDEPMSYTDPTTGEKLYS